MACYDRCQVGTSSPSLCASEKHHFSGLIFPLKSRLKPAAKLPPVAECLVQGRGLGLKVIAEWSPSFLKEFSRFRVIFLTTNASVPSLWRDEAFLYIYIVISLLLTTEALPMMRTCMQTSMRISFLIGLKWFWMLIISQGNPHRGVESKFCLADSAAGFEVVWLIAVSLQSQKTSLSGFQ